jgi:hypothetical protein
VARVGRECLLREIREELYEPWLRLRAQLAEMDWDKEGVCHIVSGTFELTESEMEALFGGDSGCFPTFQCFVSIMQQEVKVLLEEEEEEEAKKNIKKTEAAEELDPETEAPVDVEKLKRRLQQEVHSRFFELSAALQQLQQGGKPDKSQKKNEKTEDPNCCTQAEFQAVLAEFLPKVVQTNPEDETRVYMWSALHAHLAPEANESEAEEPADTSEGKKQRKQTKPGKQAKDQLEKAGVDAAEEVPPIRVSEFLALVQVIPPARTRLPTADELLDVATGHVFKFWTTLQRKLKLVESRSVPAPTLASALREDFDLYSQEAADVCCLLDPYDKVCAMGFRLQLSRSQACSSALLILSLRLVCSFRPRPLMSSPSVPCCPLLLSLAVLSFCPLLSSPSVCPRSQQGCIASQVLLHELVTDDSRSTDEVYGDGSREYQDEEGLSTAPDPSLELLHCCSDKVFHEFHRLQHDFTQAVAAPPSYSRQNPRLSPHRSMSQDSAFTRPVKPLGTASPGTYVRSRLRVGDTTDRPTSPANTDEVRQLTPPLLDQPPIQLIDPTQPR